MALFPCVVQYIFVTYFVHNSLYLLIPYACLAPSSSHHWTGSQGKWKWKSLSGVQLCDPTGYTHSP